MLYRILLYVTLFQVKWKIVSTKQNSYEISFKTQRCTMFLKTIKLITSKNGNWFNKMLCLKWLIDSCFKYHLTKYLHTHYMYIRSNFRFDFAYTVVRKCITSDRSIKWNEYKNANIWDKFKTRKVNNPIPLLKKRCVSLRCKGALL